MRNLYSIPKIVVFALFVLLTAANFTSYSQNCSVNAGTTQTICENATLTLVGQKSGLFQGAGTTTWSQVAGPAVIITNPNDLTTTVVGHSGGNSYTFRLSTTCEDGSLIFQDVVINVLTVTAATATGGFTSCPGTNVGTIYGNIPGDDESGSWEIINNGGGATVNSPNSPTSTITFNTNCGTTTLRWNITNSNGCSSSSNIISIVNLGGVVPIDAGTDRTLSNCYSTVQSETLTATSGGCGIGGQQGSWSIISGPNVPTFSLPNNSTTTVSNLIEGTYRFRWTVSGPCINGFDEVDITVPAATASITTAYAGANQQFCDERETTILTGNSPIYVNETVLWEKVGIYPDVTIVNPTLPVTQITGLDGSSTYSFRYTISNNTTGCSSSSLVTVSYFPDAPSVTITQKPILISCESSTAVIPYIYTGSGVTQYRVISSPIGTFTFPTTWTSVYSSPASINGFTEIGSYVVQFRRYTAVDVSCGTEYDEVTVIVSESPILANAGTPQILNCNVPSTVLAGNDPGDFIGTWSQVGGPTTVTLSDPNAHNLGISGLIPGLYTFRWTIYGGPTCPQNSDEVTVVVASVTPTFHDAGLDQTVCSGSPLQLNAEIAHFPFEIGVWSVSPSAGIVFSDSLDHQATVTGLQNSTIYTFTWTMKNGCGSNSDDVIITVNDNIGAIASNAGPDQCLNAGVTSTTLAGNNPPDGTASWSQKSGPNSAVFTDASLYNTTVTNLIDGTYVFLWTITAGVGCNPTVDSVMITIGGVTASVAPADVILCGNSYTLVANATGSGESGLWTQVMGNAGPVIQTPTSNSTLIT
ncbi:MAG: hypothetical protein CVU02_01325, partial [Bacteroidetes bacterium HGW-Bacteroidetes-19]